MDINSTEILQVVDWSRAQFALTAMYHWLFVPLTLGLAFLCAIMETIYYRTGDEFWKRTVKFWMKLFGINFAIGIATGLILEFQFGTNWSNYSHFVGDIFGAPLAIEGIMAFFLEATFVAVMFFGWNKVSKGFHLTATWMTALGANLSALWILVANGWMQYPVGMLFNIETARNEMTSFWEVLFSPVAINKFFHTVTSSYLLSAVFVIGVSAWFLLRRREQLMARRSMWIATIFGLIATLLTAYTGDGSGVQVAKVQPMKLAAMEALYDGEKGADLTVIGLLRPDGERTGNEDAFHFRIKIPKMLSLIGYHDFDAYVAGINDLVKGNPEEGILSAQEKIDRGRVAIDQLTAFRQAKDAKDTAAMNAIKDKFDPQTAEGKEFIGNYFRYFGYGFLNSPQDIVPPVGLVFYSFRVMVGLGVFFIALFFYLLFVLKKRDIEKQRWLLYVLIWSIPLAYIAGQAGWIVAEVGRQPWTIQDLLPSVASITAVKAGSVQTTFILFAVLFTVLLIAELKILFKQINIGPSDKH